MSTKSWKKPNKEIFSKLDSMDFCNENDFYRHIFSWVKDNVITNRQFTKLMVLVADKGIDINFSEHCGYQRRQKFYLNGQADLSTR